MWILGRKGPSGFSACSTAEQVTQGIDATGLTAIVTGLYLSLSLSHVHIFSYSLMGLFRYQFLSRPFHLMVQFTFLIQEHGKD